MALDILKHDQVGADCWQVELLVQRWCGSVGAWEDLPDQ